MDTFVAAMTLGRGDVPVIPVELRQLITSHAAEGQYPFGCTLL